MIVDFKRLLHNGGLVVANKYPTILTGVGIAGVFITSGLAVQATVDAVRIIDKDEMVGGTAGDIKERIRNRSRLVWKLYVPSVVSGICTIGCIVSANRTSAKRAAALATAYSITQKAFGDYRAKVVETLGETRETGIRDAVAKDRLRKNPSSSEVIIAAGGKTLCFDEFTGRYFESDVETLRRAQNDINHQILSDMYASLSDFYRLIGLSPTSYSDEVGWTSDQNLRLEFSACMSDDNRPCISVGFSTEPCRDYYKFG